MMNLSSGTPRPCYVKRMLRQVSWLSGHHALPAFPVDMKPITSGKMGQRFADYSCGGSPGFLSGVSQMGTGFPFDPQRGTFDGKHFRGLPRFVSNRLATQWRISANDVTAPSSPTDTLDKAVDKLGRTSVTRCRERRNAYCLKNTQCVLGLCKLLHNLRNVDTDAAPRRLVHYSHCFSCIV